MSEIWLDVTTLLAWHRPVVGVVRVESECALFMLDSDRERFRFCRFDKGKGYSEVTAGEVGRKLRHPRYAEDDRPLPEVPGKPEVAEAEVPGRNEAVAVEEGIQTVEPDPELSRIVRYKRSTVRLIARLPDPVAQPILRFGSRRKEGLFTLLSAAGHLRRGVRQVVVGNRQLHRPAVPQPPPPPVPPADVPPVPEEATELPAETAAMAHPFAEGDVYISMGLDWDQKDLPYLYAVKNRIGLRVVLFCYDIIPVKFPHLCVGDVAAFFAQYFADVAWCADRILCISECSRRDLSELLTQLGTPVPTMDVVQLGCSLKMEQTVDVPFADQVGDDFILFVSTIERRKNHITLYHAYARLCEADVPNLPRMVFVGMRGWGVEELFADIRLDPRLKGRVVCLHEVTDAQLNELYARARFTVFPSLYEGWGLAVGESLARGKFCLASDAASIPEVGQEFVEYLDPLDVPAWSERLRHYIENDGELEARSRRIREEYVPLDWGDAAGAIVRKALVRVDETAVPPAA